MKPLKTGIALLLAGAFIVLCAFLPWGISWFLDRSATGSLGSAQIQSVELSLFGSTTPDDQLERLAMAQAQATILISPEQASMTQDEVEKHALYAMNYFYSLGLMERKDLILTSAEPYLVVNQDDIARFLICWDVQFSVNKGLTSFYVLIDDETGKALRCSYHTDAGIFLSSEQKDKAMEQLCPAFWTQLGIMDQINRDAPHLRSSRTQQSSDRITVTNSLYPNPDSTEAILTMDFEIYSNGFYTRAGYDAGK